ncbi:MAG: ABC transporter permease, partial [Acetivibrio ethanolgignens]
YALHYVYLSAGVYEKLFGEYPEFNLLFYETYDSSEIARDTFAKEVLNYEAASEVQSNAEAKKNVEDMLDSLNVVVYVLIICAGLLAFVVLYNLNNININERRRELATLRVLGFYNREVAAYVYRESIMLTGIGIVVGIFLGIVLHRYVILTAEIDMLMFGRNINKISFLYSAILTAVFSALINWIMYFKLKKIDMVESLKSIE